MKTLKGFKDSFKKSDEGKEITKCEKCKSPLCYGDIISRRYFGENLQSIILLCSCNEGTIIYPM